MPVYFVSYLPELTDLSEKGLSSPTDSQLSQIGADFWPTLLKEDPIERDSIAVVCVAEFQMDKNGTSHPDQSGSRMVLALELAHVRCMHSSAIERYNLVDKRPLDDLVRTISDAAGQEVGLIFLHYKIAMGYLLRGVSPGQVCLVEVAPSLCLVAAETGAVNASTDAEVHSNGHEHTAGSEVVECCKPYEHRPSPVSEEVQAVPETRRTSRRHPREVIPSESFKPERAAYLEDEDPPYGFIEVALFLAVLVVAGISIYLIWNDIK